MWELLAAIGRGAAVGDGGDAEGEGVDCEIWDVVVELPACVLRAAVAEAGPDAVVAGDLRAE